MGEFPSRPSPALSGELLTSKRRVSTGRRSTGRKTACVVSAECLSLRTTASALALGGASRSGSGLWTTGSMTAPVLVESSKFGSVVVEARRLARSACLMSAARVGDSGCFPFRDRTIPSDETVTASLLSFQAQSAVSLTSTLRSRTQGSGRVTVVESSTRSTVWMEESERRRMPDGSELRLTLCSISRLLTIGTELRYLS
eukprot:3110581-Rhodomonas_salina.1